MISNLLSYAKKCHDPILFFHVNPQLFIAIFFIVTTCDFLPVTVRLFLPSQPLSSVPITSSSQFSQNIPKVLL